MRLPAIAKLAPDRLAKTPDVAPATVPAPRPAPDLRGVLGVCAYLIPGCGLYAAMVIFVGNRERRRLPHATHRPAPGSAEQEPAEWWRNLRRGVLGLTGRHRVSAIGVTGQMHGLVIHDDTGEVIRPAITWEDRRSADAIPTLRARHPDLIPALIEHPHIAFALVRSAESGPLVLCAGVIAAPGSDGRVYVTVRAPG